MREGENAGVAGEHLQAQDDDEVHEQDDGHGALRAPARGIDEGEQRDDGEQEHGAEGRTGQVATIQAHTRSALLPPNSPRGLITRATATKMNTNPVVNPLIP